MKIYYVTGNLSKFKTAEHFLKKAEVEIEQKVLDIPEIQSEDIIKIAEDKAEKAFKEIGKPLFINDSGWYIEALNGFPGPYMKDVNNWFSPKDFINLIKPYKNRKVILRQVVVYKDSIQTKTFVHDSRGEILNESKGSGRPSDTVISFTKDGKSIVEQSRESVLEIEEPLWDEFANWLKTIP